MKPTPTKILHIVALLLTLSLSAAGQITLRAVAGVSNVEHLSTGIEVNFSNRQNIALLLGTNAFIRTNNFVSYLLQYDVQVNELKFYGITPRLGLKGGYSIYTNDYYRWKLVQVVPFVDFSCPLNNKIGLYTDLGMAISHELSIDRVAFGEIGSYKQYLPELKLGVSYRF